jgi:hypothetical protein
MSDVKQSKPLISGTSSAAASSFFQPPFVSSAEGFNRTYGLHTVGLLDGVCDCVAAAWPVTDINIHTVDPILIDFGIRGSTAVRN